LRTNESTTRDPSLRQYARRLPPLLLLVFLAIACVPSGRVPLAIQGYDPVAFFTAGRPMLGISEIEVEREGVRYRFSSEENREAFAKDPSLYVPQFGDYCAMALSKGELVDADPENWLIVEGKLYIFGKPIGAVLFQQDLAGNVLKANRNRSLLPKP
jgi:hypothetical protein